jgi:hypothetical protein
MRAASSGRVDLQQRSLEVYAMFSISKNAARLADKRSAELEGDRGPAA